MSSNLKVNTILPSTGDTVAISGIVSVTNGAKVLYICPEKLETLVSLPRIFSPA